MILTRAFLKILMLTRSKVKCRNNDKVYLDCLSIVSLYVTVNFLLRIMLRIKTGVLRTP